MSGATSPPRPRYQLVQADFASASASSSEIGLDLHVRKGEKIVVSAVSGQAKELGIRVKDVLVAIGEKDINPSVSHDELGALLRSAPRPLSIVFLRKARANVISSDGMASGDDEPSFNIAPAGTQWWGAAAEAQNSAGGNAVAAPGTDELAAMVKGIGELQKGIGAIDAKVSWHVYLVDYTPHLQYGSSPN